MIEGNTTMLHWPSILKTLGIMLPIWFLLEASRPWLENRLGTSIPENLMSMLTGGLSVLVLIVFLRGLDPEQFGSGESERD